MLKIAISQRVDVVAAYEERRDALDQRWADYLFRLNMLAIPLPNHPEHVLNLMQEIQFQGVLLTGGNDQAAYGGTAPERDSTEAVLLQEAERQEMPVLGVCRGLQVLATTAGGILTSIDRHVATRHAVKGELGPRLVNSYHNWGIRQLPSKSWKPLAQDDDGNIEAMVDESGRQLGIMWHPEREIEPNAQDAAMISDFFLQGGYQRQS